GQARDAALVHLEAAHLVGRAEPVLHPPHHPQRRVLVALEVQHDVHQVLQHAGPGDLSVLRDVPDQYRRDAALFRHGYQYRGDAPDLRDTAGHTVDAGGGDGLHRVEHEQPRLDRVEVAEYRAEVGLGGEVQPLVQRTDAFGAQPHLAHRLLAAD